MEKLPGNKSFECIFKIIKNGHPNSWYKAGSGFIGKYFLGIYCSHHKEDTNILLTSKRLTLDGEADASVCGWVYLSLRVREQDKTPVVIFDSAGDTELFPRRRGRQSVYWH